MPTPAIAFIWLPARWFLVPLNLWQVHDVRVQGRGMIIYDGPQDPAGDEGWMHLRSWHCIVMDQTQERRDRRPHLHCAQPDVADSDARTPG